ncbi:MAG: DUF4258 domain-containing protein [Psychrosphaera sp.]|nr:DUF4258 domain-containing protein [Psychrosphaera sp.]
MNNKSPAGVNELPLSQNTAKKIIKELALNHTNSVKLSSHARQRMKQRGVTNTQILKVLSSAHSVFTEAPHMTAGGDWKFNLQGVAAGEVVEVVVVLRRLETDPCAFVVTVMVM